MQIINFKQAMLNSHLEMKQHNQLVQDAGVLHYITMTCTLRCDCDLKF